LVKTGAEEEKPLTLGSLPSFLSWNIDVAAGIQKPSGHHETTNMRKKANRISEILVLISDSC
jgi:hypothetical protein